MRFPDGSTRVGSLPRGVPARTPARWTGATTDDRREERRALLVAAGFELLGGEGLLGTTVRAVCRAARLSPRYFYESFADVDELLVAVYDRVVTDLRQAVLAAAEAAGATPAEQARAVIEATVGFVAEDRRRGRILYVESLGNEALNRRRIETLESVVEALGAPAAQVGRIGATMLVGGFSELVAGWLAGRIDVGAEQLVDDAAELFVALGRTTARLAARRSSPG